MTKQDEEIADLRRELEEVKAKVAGPPPPPSEESWKKFQSDMHAARERHMNLATNFLTKEDYRAMDAACPTSVAQDIVSKGGISGPSGQVPTSGQVGPVHTSP